MPLVMGRLFTFVSAVSALLLVAVCVLWARSVGHRSYGYWIGPERYVEVTETDGVLGVMFTRDSGLRPPVSGTNDLYGVFYERAAMRPGQDRASGQTPTFNRWGFGGHIGRTVGHPPAGYWRIGGRRLWIAWVPYWLVALLLAVFPAASAARLVQRRRRSAAGLCRHCGYDLRESPDGCPPSAGRGGPGLEAGRQSLNRREPTVDLNCVSCPVPSPCHSVLFS